MPRVANRPGYDLVCLSLALLALGDTWDWPAGDPVRPHPATSEEGPPDPSPGTPPILQPPHLGPLSLLQAPERPLMGVNGLDVTSLRPFDLVIPFTIKKGEITGKWE